MSPLLAIALFGWACGGTGGSDATGDLGGAAGSDTAGAGGTSAGASGQQGVGATAGAATGGASSGGTGGTPAAGAAGSGASSFGGGGAGGGGLGGAAGKAGAGGGASGGATGGASATGGSSLGGASSLGGNAGNGGKAGNGAAGSAGSAGNIIYAHSNTELYELDPTAATPTLTKIGAFDCIGGAGQDTSMTDVAVNQQGDVWAISVGNVYRLTITGSTVHCAQTIPLKNAKGVKFYGLSFAPVGVLGTTETLVAGNTDGELWAIDAMGGLTLRGTLGTVPADDGHGHNYPAAHVGKPWELSGDIVFLYNGGDPVGFATVRDCPTPPSTTGCSTNDTLIQIDLGKLGAATPGPVALGVRGQVTKGATCKDTTNGTYGSMYGIAAWNQTVYGFSNSGDLVAIDTADGSTCLTQAFMGTKFAGAGVTTLAPVHKP